MKKILCNTLIMLFMLGVCINVHPFIFGVSSFSSFNAYAADNGGSDEWKNSDLSMQAKAFIAYCKSNNLVISGSALDVITSVTTETYNKICNTIGLSPTELQAEIKYATGGNLGLRFLFTQTGATAMNRIFAEFLQNNDLSVGDTVEDKELFSGKVFTDSEGRQATVYIMKKTSSSYIAPSEMFSQMGSVYRFDNADLISIWQTYQGGNSPTYYINGKTYYFICQGDMMGQYTRQMIIQPGGGTVKSYFSGVEGGPSSMGIILLPDGKLYLGAVRYSNADKTLVNVYLGVWLNDNNNVPNVTDENVTANTVNNTNITNNNYTNNNYTIIYNDGDTYYTDDDDEPPPDTPPGGGGNDDPLDPYDPTKPFPDTPDNPTPDPGVVGSPGSDGTITIPDFNFDIPDINWSLDGLQHKFPFSLPFDLYNACKLLNAEPETPELDYTIDLVVYQWPVNYDLHWLDPAARVIRIFELLAFVVGLILITRHIIGG